MKKLKRALVLVLVGALTVCLLAFPASAKEEMTGEVHENGYNELYNYDWRATLGAEERLAYATFYISFRSGGFRPDHIEARLDGYGVDGKNQEIVLYDAGTQYAVSSMTLSASQAINGGANSLHCYYYAFDELCTDFPL